MTGRVLVEVVRRGVGREEKLEGEVILTICVGLGGRGGSFCCLEDGGLTMRGDG